MGVGTGVGIDMIESENSPVEVALLDDKDEPCLVKNFTTG